VELSENRSKFIFDGNDVCLDFINTDIVDRGKRVDLLEDYGDVVSWLTEAGCIDPGTAERMLKLGDNESLKMLKKVREFRKKLMDMIQALSQGKPLRRSHLEPVNEILKEDTTYSNLILINGNARQITHSSSTILDPRLTIAHAAAELLTKKDLTLVRKCSNPECVLYFYDESKNHARRWCSMDRCGNRMKAALHYRKKKDRSTGSINR